MRHFRAVFISCLVVIGLCAALSWADENSAAPQQAQAQPQPETGNPEQNSLDKDISVVPTLSPSDLIPNGLTTGTAVAVGAVALFLLLATSWPAFGLRTCSLLGTCENYNNYPAVGTAYNNDAYSYSNPPPYTTTSYQKRSVSYVEPILRLLSSAYLQYGDTPKPTTRRQRRRR